VAKPSEEGKGGPALGGSLGVGGVGDDRQAVDDGLHERAAGGWIEGEWRGLDGDFGHGVCAFGVG